MNRNNDTADTVDVATLRDAVQRCLTYNVGKSPATASEYDWYQAVAYATRERIVEQWIDSTNATYLHGPKRVYYLSLEFLVGRLLFDALTNLRPWSMRCAKRRRA
jgi:starch phosphorylase